MEFMIVIFGIMTLALLRPTYRDMKLGKFPPGTWVKVLVALAIYLPVCGLGVLALENRMPAPMSEGPIGAVVGMVGIGALFGALFVVPSLIAQIAAQALAAGLMRLRGSRPTP